MAKQLPLVSKYLENISRDALEKYQGIIREYVSHEHGLYALYKGDKLYYVGLASNLRRRLSQHLRDQHGELWDRFSVYLTTNSSHMKELETLFLRILMPDGNKVKGKFQKAESLKRRLNADIKRKQEIERGKIFGTKVQPSYIDKAPSKEKIGTKTAKKGKEASLAPYVTKRFKLRRIYKGKTIIARVRQDGTINLNGTIFNSPSWAARSVIGRKANGWSFWRYRNEDGEWVKLDELRKGGASTLVKKSAVKKSDKKQAVLAGYFDKPVMLKRIYKDKEFKARVNKSGKIEFEGKIYNSPTMAGTAAIGRRVNGWTFWKYKNKNAEWVKLDELRK